MTTRRDILKALLVTPAALVQKPEIAKSAEFEMSTEFPVEPGEEFVFERATAEHLYVTVRNKKTGQERTKIFIHPARNLETMRAYWKQEIWVLKHSRRLLDYGKVYWRTCRGEYLTTIDRRKQIKKVEEALKVLEV